jgi:hypothetical protein
MIEVKCNKKKCFFNTYGVCTKKDGIVVIDGICESWYIAKANRSHYIDDDYPFGDKY